MKRNTLTKMKTIPISIQPFRHVSKSFEVSCYTGNFLIETNDSFDNEFTAFNYVVYHLGGLLFFKLLEFLHHSEMDHLDFFTKNGEKVSIYSKS